MKQGGGALAWSGLSEFLLPINQWRNKVEKFEE